MLGLQAGSLTWAQPWATGLGFGAWGGAFGAGGLDLRDGVWMLRSRAGKFICGWNF